MKNTRTEALACVSREREYQEKKWPNNPLSPSDALRVIRCLIAQSDVRWYETPDRLVEGVKINDVDLHALRKIAATAVHALERWGVADRPLSELLKVFTTEQVEDMYSQEIGALGESLTVVREANEKLLAENPRFFDSNPPDRCPDPQADPEGPDGRVNAT